MPCSELSLPAFDEAVQPPFSKGGILATLVDHKIFNSDKDSLQEIYKDVIAAKTSGVTGVTDEFVPGIVFLVSGGKVVAPEDLAVTQDFPVYRSKKSQGNSYYVVTLKGQSTGATYIMQNFKTIASRFLLDKKDKARKSTSVIDKGQEIGKAKDNLLYMAILDANYDLVDPYHQFFTIYSSLAFDAKDFASNNIGLNIYSSGAKPTRYDFDFIKSGDSINPIPAHLKALYTKGKGINLSTPTFSSAQEIADWGTRKQLIESNEKKDALAASKKAKAKKAKKKKLAKAKALAKKRRGARGYKGKRK